MNVIHLQGETKCYKHVTYKERLEQVFVFCNLFKVILYNVANGDVANVGLLIVG